MLKKLGVATLTIFILIAAGSQPVSAISGEWSNNGDTIYYTDGKVGIGTDNPGWHFRVHGPAQSLALITGDGSVTNKRLMQVSNGSGRQLVMLDNGNIGIDILDPVWDFQQNAIGTDTSFLINGNGAVGGNRFFQVSNGSGRNLIMMSNGNVGIGTSNPTKRLSVNGTIQAKEVIVETGWADYVFEDDYQLMDLAEVDKFIEANGHLPGVSSAQEVQEGGAELGTTVTKLLEKIEELTLYTIEQQKQITQLQAVVQN